MIPVETRITHIGDLEIVAEASLNNCSNLWTATAKAAGRLIASGASTTPEGALDSAIEQAQRKLAEQRLATAG